MKIALVSIVLVLFVGYSEQQLLDEKRVQTASEECIKETSVDPTVVLKLFQGGTFPDDKNFKCYLKCLFVKLGDMNESGELNLANLKSHAPGPLTPEESAKIVDTCKTKTGADTCETAYNIAKCLIEQTVQLKKP